MEKDYYRLGEKELEGEQCHEEEVRIIRSSAIYFSNVPCQLPLQKLVMFLYVRNSLPTYH